MKIAILGGSFDPPHVGHLLLAQQIKKLLNIDQVWLMPTFIHPFAKGLTPAKHRLAMTKLLEDETIKVSDFEILQKGTSYTINTLRQLAKIHPDDRFFWIIGSDQIENFPQWKEWDKIFTEFKLIIYARNTPVPQLEQIIQTAWNLVSLPQNVYILNTKDLLTSPASSSEIRERIKKGLPIKGLVPKKVESYILDHTLYK